MSTICWKNAQFKLKVSVKGTSAGESGMKVDMEIGVGNGVANENGK